MELAGKTGTLPPAQMVVEVPNAKVGVTIGETVTLNVIGKAHTPPVGVKV